VFVPFRFYHPGMLKLLSVAMRARDWYRGERPDSRCADEHRSRFYAEAWRDAAASLGASVEPLEKDVLEIRLGRACTWTRQTTTAIDDPVTLSVAANKPLVHRLLTQRGLRTPNYFEFTLSSIAEAAAFVRRFGGEWVVKPANGAGGRGVTTDVISSFDLIRAAVAAAAYGPRLVVEQQVEGDLYRLLYLEGRLLDAVLRKSPSVAADGRSSVRKLIRLENRARLIGGRDLGLALVSIDLDMRRTLAKQGLTLYSIPKKGTVVTLKRVVNENSVADNISATHQLCKSVIEDGAVAAAAVGVRLAGVDMVTRNPGVSLAESGGVILEVNTTPGYHYHYYQRDGGVAVAIPILSRLLFRPLQPRKVFTESRGPDPLDAVVST
jgi:cyanophycin synthetase